MSPAPPKRSLNRPALIAAQVPAVLKAAYLRHGFAHAQVLGRWREIVGDELAQVTLPERIRWPRSREAADARPGRRTGGCLVVRVDGPVAIELQHSAPQIIERINGYYGYAAVGTLKIVQGPIPRRDRVQRPRAEPLDETSEAAIARRVAGVRDERLRATLSKLGRSIMFAKK